MKKNGILGSILLFFAAFFWGSTFVAQSSAADSISTFTFLAARSVVGAGALWLAVLVRALYIKRKNQKADGRGAVGTPLDTPAAVRTPSGASASFKRTLVGGLCCGLAITAASAFQQYGIELGVRSGEAGFITALYMFIVPLFSFMLYKKRASLNVLFGAILTALGLYFLCILGAGGGVSLGFGHLAVLVCAVLYAVHIMVIDRFADVDGLYLSAIQFSVAAVIAGIFALMFDNHTFSDLRGAWFPIVYAGLFSTAVAYTLQIFGQKYTPTAVASVIMSLESVIAFLCEWACAAIGLLHGPVEMNFWKIAGCVIAFAGIVLVQIPSGKKG